MLCGRGRIILRSCLWICHLLTKQSSDRQSGHKMNISVTPITILSSQTKATDLMKRSKKLPNGYKCTNWKTQSKSHFDRWNPCQFKKQCIGILIILIKCIKIFFSSQSDQKKKIEHQRLQEVHWLVRDAAAIPSYKPFSNCFKYIDIEWYLCGFILISCFMTNQIVRLYH